MIGHAYAPSTSHCVCFVDNLLTAERCPPLQGSYSGRVQLKDQTWQEVLCVSFKFEVVDDPL
jgi:hypothetical protein